MTTIMTFSADQLARIAGLLRSLEALDDEHQGVYLQGPVFVKSADGYALGSFDSPDGMWEFTPVLEVTT